MITNNSDHSDWSDGEEKSYRLMAFLFPEGLIRRLIY